MNIPNTDAAIAVTLSASPAIDGLERVDALDRSVLSHYLKLFRFHYHASFVSVIAGAFLSGRKATPDLWLKLPLLYLSFNVLLYGGIYIINAIADVESDRSHPKKRARPLPSCNIGTKSALNLLLVLIASGLTSGLLLFGQPVLLLYLGAVGLNLFYSFAARRVPYLDILANASTHPLRFLLGVTVVDGRTPPLLLLSIFLTAIGFASARRRLEREQPGWQARESLRYYTDRSLRVVELIAFMALLTISILDDSVPGPFYLVIVTVYLVAITGLDYLAPVKKLFVGIWTRC